MNNIILIGFMGSGKTAVGTALAEKIKWKYTDLDAVIVKNARMPISRIFEKYGEKYFRKLESKAAGGTRNIRKQVVATGGGIITTRGNAALLKKSGTVVYLKNTFKTSSGRIGDRADRPLFRADRLKEARALYKKRLPMYAAAADITIITDKKDVNGVVDAIIKKLGAKIELS